MADKTSYTIEVWDPQYIWGLEVEDEEKWTVLNSTVYDTFSEADEAAKDHTPAWRRVRIRKHVWSVVARFQDGVVVE